MRISPPKRQGDCFHSSGVVDVSERLVALKLSLSIAANEHHMAQEKCKLLIVDDETALSRTLRAPLAGGDFEVSEARTVEEALSALRQAPSDIVLLDINKHGGTGFEVCQRIRTSAPQIGVIVVTVCDSEEDMVQAIQAGADDFVTKPYRLHELIARLRAVLRRLKEPAHRAEAVLRAGDLELDLDRRLVLKHGAEVHLTPKEFDLLAYLFRHPGATVLHSKLLRAVWGLEYGGELEYLRTYVRTLRKKIEDDPARPEYLVTEPWVGYRFCNPSVPGRSYSPSAPARAA